MKKIGKILSLCTIVWIVFLLGGCQKEETEISAAGSTTCGNITMGNGVFAYENDFIYFHNSRNIFEHDLETGKTITIKYPDNTMILGMFSQDQYVYYAAGGLNRVRKDGKKYEKVAEWSGGCWQLWVENNKAYYLESVEGSLFCRDLMTNKGTEILTKVLAYYVDEEYIYAVAKKDTIPYLFISERNEINFQVKELSFAPIKVFVADGELYLAERGTYQIIKYSSKGEERLPIYGVYYQVIGDRILYLDSQNYKNSCFELSMYNMATGETRSLCKEVFDFNVFEDEYVCIEQHANNSNYLLYDLNTGEMTVMHGEAK